MISPMNEGGISLGRTIDARKLMYFALIVQHGSLGKAAKALRMSQPALSISMDRLEVELEAKLLIRTPTGVEPTEKGEAIVRHARKILECISAVEDEMFACGATQKAALHFGCLPTLAGSVVPQAICRWRTDHPEIELQVTERPQNELLWGLLRREYDFSVGVVDADNHAYGLRQRVLFRERLYVIGRSEHPLATQESITLDDLTHFAWVSPTTGWRNTALEQILEPEGLILQHNVTVCSSVSLLKSLISDTNNLALLPAHAVQDEIVSRKLMLLPFDQDNLARNIAVFLRENTCLDEPSLALLELIQEQGRLRYLKESRPVL
ncbi:LysR family transcriptional regulator [Mesorhizobium sp. M00.F.Ca.ET.149.01.1.1]|nr:LysR family transcriptional regulator [Mesorhizobium sp. M8A.F.Ca.ET.197.01.1.1]TGR37070.1 LysR family transcriptional regulator [bacterium M00.F.Ca.ET.199.01.1.1]TGR41592.1 LysR family transcriptional regulator [Mesorhizobium sp. M8A.F.Ca.ET.198.01.1.1]TGV85303.1 LysR family transcriptional regulator [Mesorhizobium sp. M00.F.Ca.ET.149.01.1.1]